jgi:CRP-like cAMP-binding protein
MTSYVEGTDSSRTRVQSLRRGAFINEDSLFASLTTGAAHRAHPLRSEYSTIADSDCVLLSLTRARYQELVDTHHAVALDIQRVILTRAAIRRNKLERELYALSQVQRESLRIARQSQMKNFRLQLRCTVKSVTHARRSTSDASKVVDKQVQSLFAEFVSAQREIAYGVPQTPEDVAEVDAKDVRPRLVRGLTRSILVSRPS